MSATVDVRAVLVEARERARQAGNHELSRDLLDANSVVAELITELRHAHEIIQLALSHVPAEARSPWFLAIDDAGLCGDGVTRFHERKSLLARVGGAA